MGTKRVQVHDSMLPVLAYTRAKRINEAKFAAELGVSHGRFTNWKRRGVPQGMHAKVAGKIGKSTDQYLAEIGRPTGAPTKQGRLLTVPHMDDFEGLPDFLQTYIAKKTAEFRRRWDEIPAWFREKLAPPKDPAHYREWERDIEGLIMGFKRNGQ